MINYLKRIQNTMLKIILAIFQILLGIGFIGFWGYFFAVENNNPERSEIYLAFERSFPIPDLLWITPNLFIAAVGLFMDQAFGDFFTAIVGSALLFLGLLDISFNARQGGYTGDIGDTIMNLFINGVCVIFGPIFILYGWYALVP